MIYRFANQDFEISDSLLSPTNGETISELDERRIVACQAKTLSERISQVEVAISNMAKATTVSEIQVAAKIVSDGMPSVSETINE